MARLLPGFLQALRRLNPLRAVTLLGQAIANRVPHVKQAVYKLMRKLRGVVQVENKSADKQITIRLFHGGMDGEKSKDGFWGWVQNNPTTSWIRFGGLHYVDEGTDFEYVVPAPFLSQFATTNLIVKRGKTGVFGQGRFVNHVCRMSDPACFLYKLERVDADAGDLLTSMVSNECVVQILRVVDAPSQTLHVRHRRERPLAEGSPMLASRWIQPTLAEWVTLTSSAPQTSKDCVTRAIIDRVAERYNKKQQKNKNPKNMDKRMLYQLMLPDQDFDVENPPPVSFEQAERAARKLKFSLRFYAPSGKEIGRYDPPGMGDGYPIVCLIVHDYHAYPVTNPQSVKNLGEFEHSVSVKASPSLRITTGAAPKADAVVKNVDELIRVTTELFEQEHVLIYWAGRSLKDAIIELINTRHYTPTEVVENDSGQVVSFRMSGATIEVKQFQFGTSAQFDHSTLTLELVNAMLHHQHQLRLCQRGELASEYGTNDPSVASLSAPRRLRFEDDVDVLSLDTCSAYPSILRDMSRVPVFADEFEPYDGHAPEPWTQYIVLVSQASRQCADWKQLATLYPVNVNIVYGQFLRYNPTIIAFKRPCLIVPTPHYKEEITKVLESDLPRTVSKSIANSCIGTVGKRFNKRFRCFPCKSEEEARALKQEHGGAIRYFLDHGDPIWCVRTRSKVELTAGFDAIQLYIYCKQKCDLIDLIDQIGPDNVVGVHTDAVKVKPGTDVSRFRLKRDVDDEALKSCAGEVFNEGAQHFDCVPFVPGVAKTPTLLAHTYVQTSDPVDFRDFLERPTVLVLGSVAGSGKTTLIRDHLQGCENVVWVSPSNAQAQDNEGITLYHLCGKFPGKEREPPVNPTNGWTTVVFEECAQWGFHHWCMVWEYMRKNPNTQYIANGDEFQLPTVEAHRNLDYPHRTFFQRMATKTFKNVIYLTTSHRQSDGPERKADVFERNLPVAQLLTKYATRITNDEALQIDVVHIALANSLVDYVNEKAHRSAEFYPGLKLRYISSQSVKSIHTDYVLKIESVTDTHITFENHGPMDVDFVRANFSYDYACTGHKVQGKTLSKPLVIWHPLHKHIEREWIYVALTRTKDGVPLYWTTKPDADEITEVQIKKQIVKAIHGYKCQDRKKGAVNDLTPESVRKLCEDAHWKCWSPMRDCHVVCAPAPERNKPASWTLDRVNSKKPHNLDNVRLCCLQCNSRKRNRHLL